MGKKKEVIYDSSFFFLYSWILRLKRTMPPFISHINHSFGWINIFWKRFIPYCSLSVDLFCSFILNPIFFMTSIFIDWSVLNCVKFNTAVHFFPVLSVDENQESILLRKGSFLFILQYCWNHNSSIDYWLANVS